MNTLNASTGTGNIEPSSIGKLVAHYTSAPVTGVRLPSQIGQLAHVFAQHSAFCSRWNVRLSNTSNTQYMELERKEGETKLESLPIILIFLIAITKSERVKLTLTDAS